MPSELASPSRAKHNVLDKAPLRRINELQVDLRFIRSCFPSESGFHNLKIKFLQEHESLTPTTSNSDFLKAGGWDGDQNSELLDGQPPPRIARISFSEPPEVQGIFC